MNRPGSGRFIMMQISRDMQSEAREGEPGKKRARQGGLRRFLPPSPRRLLFATWLSPRLFPSDLFFVRSFSSLQPFLPRPHLLAGVINDLTDTLDERCRESVKQVVIKTDAVSLRGGGERRQRKKEKKLRRKRNGWNWPRRERKRKRKRTSEVYYILEYESPFGYSTYRELDCKVEINIIRYVVRSRCVSRGDKECNKYEKVETKPRVVRYS